MTPRPTLHLHEELLLLALRDDAGTIAQGTTISYAMGAAVLAELLLHERIAVDDTKKKIGRKPVAFPTDFGMIMDGAEHLQPILIDIIQANRWVLEGV